MLASEVELTGARGAAQPLQNIDPTGFEMPDLKEAKALLDELDRPGAIGK